MSILTSKDTEPLPHCARQSYLIGQDPEGHGLAVETHGLGGGIFRSRADAIHFAEFEADHSPDAVRFTAAPIGLIYAKTPGSGTSTASRIALQRGR